MVVSGTLRILLVLAHSALCPLVCGFKIPDGMKYAKGADGMCPMAALVADESAVALDLEGGTSPRHLIEAAPGAADAVRENKGPHYVFVSGVPGSGTTALAGLLYTSPEAANLCASGTLFCEGRQMFKSEREGPEVTHRSGFKVHEAPDGIFEAIETWNQFWDTSKTMLVEKSPYRGETRGQPERGRDLRYEEVHKNLTERGHRVSFVFTTRSPCFRDGHTILTDNHTDAGNEARERRRGGKAQPRFWGYSGMRELFDLIDRLRQAGARVLEVKFEEMVTDPFGTSRTILEFLPELRSLDSSRSGYEEAPCFKKKLNDGQAHKAIPLAVYAKTKLGKFVTGTFSGFADTQFIGQQLEKHGYTEEWFSGPHVRADHTKQEL